MRDDRLWQAMKIAAVLTATATLLFGAGGSLFGAAEIGLYALKRQYWRPAAIPYPKEDPYSRAKEELGRVLFFDPVLSGAHVRSCATCHNPGLSWGDGEPRAIGENQVRLPLRSPTLLATEDLNRRWYEASTGQVITDIQKKVRHPALRWMGATLDGRIEGSDAVFEAKFMLPWSFSEEGALPS
jgi:cytochrome c peroxidase